MPSVQSRLSRLEQSIAERRRVDAVALQPGEWCIDAGWAPGESAARRRQDQPEFEIPISYAIARRESAALWPATTFAVPFGASPFARRLAGLSAVLLWSREDHSREAARLLVETFGSRLVKDDEGNMRPAATVPEHDVVILHVMQMGSDDSHDRGRLRRRLVDAWRSSELPDQLPPLSMTDAFRAYLKTNPVQRFVAARLARSRGAA